MRLLHLEADKVQKLIEGMDKECIGIRKTALSLSWHTRGGASYEDVLNMSTTERQLINELVEHNLEVTKTSQLPYF